MALPCMDIRHKLLKIILPGERWSRQEKIQMKLLKNITVTRQLPLKRREENVSLILIQKNLISHEF